MKKLYFLFLMFFSVKVNAEQWKNYTNSLTVTCIAVENDTVWVGSQGGLSKFLSDGTFLASYTHADGLAHNNVSSIAIDSNGNKWIASASSSFGDIGGGVSKFDGTYWTVYHEYNSALSGSQITGIAIDRQNNVWVSIYLSGIAKFDGVNWINYNTSNSSLPSNYINNIMSDMLGNIWMKSYNSSGVLVKIDGTNWSLFNSPFDLADMTFDSQNNLWAVTPGSHPTHQSKVGKFDGSDWTIYSSSNFGSLHPVSIVIDELGNKWFGSGQELWKYDDVIWTRDTILDMNLDFDERISFSYYTLNIDNSGNKWFGTAKDSRIDFGKGVGRYDGVNTLVLNPSENEMPGNSVYSFSVDHHGNKWISAFNPWENLGCGITKFNNEGWDCISPYSTLINKVDKNNLIWFGGYSFDGTNWNAYQNAPNQVNVIAIDNQNNKWFGSDGLYKFDGTNSTHYNESNRGLLSDYINAIAIDDLNNKWIGTYFGVSKFDDTNWTNYTTSNSALPDSVVYAIAVDKQGNKWFGTRKGISKFDGVNWITYDTSNSVLGGNEISDIAVDKTGNIWCAIRWGKGVSKFNGTTWTTYTTYNSGLGGNEVRSIIVDDWNNVWFATSIGASELLSSDSLYSVWLQFSENICTNNTITLNPVINYGTPPYTFSWQSIGNSLSCINCQNPTATITENSVFIVSVTDSNNIATADTLQVYYCGYTEIEERKNPKTDVSIFPNPATNRLNINARGIEILAVRIYSTTGQLMLETEQLQNEGVDISKLVAGFYIAEIKAKETSVMKRWVKM